MIWRVPPDKLARCLQIGQQRGTIGAALQMPLDLQYRPGVELAVKICLQLQVFIARHGGSLLPRGASSFSTVPVPAPTAT